MRFGRKKKGFRHTIRERKIKGFLAFIVIISLIITNLVLISSLCVKIRDIITQDSAFRISRIQMTGCEKISKDYLLGWLGKLVEGNIFKIDIEQLRKRIMMHSLIKDASVKRKLPNQLVIDISERHAIAMALSEREYDVIYCIDEDAYIIEITKDFKELPRIYINRPIRLKEGKQIQHQGLMNALIVLELYSSSILRNLMEIDYFRTDEKGNVQFVASVKTVVLLGNIEYEKRLTRLVSILEDLKSKSQRASLIDLRFEAVPIKLFDDPVLKSADPMGEKHAKIIKM